MSLREEGIKLASLIVTGFQDKKDSLKEVTAHDLGSVFSTLVSFGADGQVLLGPLTEAVSTRLPVRTLIRLLRDWPRADDHTGLIPELAIAPALSLVKGLIRRGPPLSKALQDVVLSAEGRLFLGKRRGARCDLIWTLAEQILERHEFSETAADHVSALLTLLVASKGHIGAKAHLLVEKMIGVCPVDVLIGLVQSPDRERFPDALIERLPVIAKKVLTEGDLFTSDLSKAVTDIVHADLAEDSEACDSSELARLLGMLAARKADFRILPSESLVLLLESLVRQGAPCADALETLMVAMRSRAPGTKMKDFLSMLNPNGLPRPAVALLTGPCRELVSRMPKGCFSADAVDHYRVIARI
jgi:hypothetical protein